MNDSYAFLKRIVLGIYYDFSKDAIAVLDKFKANDNKEQKNDR